MFLIMWALNLQTKPSSMVWNLTRTQFPIFWGPKSSKQHHPAQICSSSSLHAAPPPSPSHAAPPALGAAAGIGCSQGPKSRRDRRPRPRKRGKLPWRTGFWWATAKFCWRSTFWQRETWKNYKWQFWDWCSSLVSITKLVSVWFEVSCWDCFQAL